MAPLSARVTVPTVGDTTRVVLSRQSDIVITPGITYGPVKVAAPRHHRSHASSGDAWRREGFTIQEDQTWFTARADRSEVRALFAQLGSVPGSTVDQRADDPDRHAGGRAGGENIRGIQVPFVARHDEEIGSTTGSATRR